MPNHRIAPHTGVRNIYVKPDLRALGEPAGDHVHPHVLPVQQRVACGEQKGSGKQIPLDFKKAVGAVIEDLAHRGVEPADYRGRENEPDDGQADALIEPVNASG